MSRITDTLLEEERTILIISRSGILRMGNVLGKSCTDNQNTHFTFNNFFSKIVPFMK